MGARGAPKRESRGCRSYRSRPLATGGPGALALPGACGALVIARHLTGTFFDDATGAVHGFGRATANRRETDDHLALLFPALSKVLSRLFSPAPPAVSAWNAILKWRVR